MSPRAASAAEVHSSTWTHTSSAVSGRPDLVPGYRPGGATRKRPSRQEPPALGRLELTRSLGPGQEAFGPPAVVGVVDGPGGRSARIWDTAGDRGWPCTTAGFAVARSASSSSRVARRARRRQPAGGGGRCRVDHGGGVVRGDHGLHQGPPPRPGAPSALMRRVVATAREFRGPGLVDQVEEPLIQLATSSADTHHRQPPYPPATARSCLAFLQPHPLLARGALHPRGERLHPPRTGRQVLLDTRESTSHAPAGSSVWGDPLTPHTPGKRR